MIVSMTGFGDAAVERNGTHYAVEIRALNNRFFKPVIKLPESVSGLEPELETLLRQRLVRGTITYVLKMRMNSAAAAYHINIDALKAYLRQLRELADLEKTGAIDLANLLQLPGVCQEPRDESDEIATHGDAIRAITETAIERVQAMRAREGQALCQDLLKHAHYITDRLAEVRKHAPDVIKEYHKRLTQRVNELMSQSSLKVHESDLIKEVAVFAERADISEEIQRLSSHLEAFEHACNGPEHAGRKLDFIAQEMLREANTIASKANDASVAIHIVDIKGAIDRLKEQVQNVE
jgi:uncharacterized protein (TIGR00255 family)